MSAVLPSVLFVAIAAQVPTDTWTVCVQADSHLMPYTHHLDPEFSARALSVYAQTVGNIAADEPNALIDLGDTFHSECYTCTIGDADNYEEALARHEAQRPYFETALADGGHLWLVIGNHEGEQGWRLAADDPLATWATEARLTAYGNPGTAPAKNYYSVVMGDVLFVVLDPYRYTTTKPHSKDDTPGSLNGWDWTLGEDQYWWMVDTLAESSASLRVVCIHQLVGGRPDGRVPYYGRGGVEYAHLFEWGGYQEDGSWGFADERPGWPAPIHDVLLGSDVSLVLHGHDHGFAMQGKDGIVYQLVPQPSDPDYGPVFQAGGYVEGTLLPNSGHLRMTIHATGMTVEYVRSFLPGEGDNGSVEHAYTLPRKSQPRFRAVPHPMPAQADSP